MSDDPKNEEALRFAKLMGLDTGPSRLAELLFKSGALIQEKQRFYPPDHQPKAREAKCSTCRFCQGRALFDGDKSAVSLCAFYYTIIKTERTDCPDHQPEDKTDD